MGWLISGQKAGKKNDEMKRGFEIFGHSPYCLTNPLPFNQPSYKSDFVPKLKMQCQGDWENAISSNITK